MYTFVHPVCIETQSSPEKIIKSLFQHKYKIWTSMSAIYFQIEVQ
uniref:Uncharacterized protein n=1 Tax=Rhizophora mucronata TaxID=61149 RepID=A0A2P2QAI5_RHIMU